MNHMYISVTILHRIPSDSKTGLYLKSADIWSSGRMLYGRGRLASQAKQPSSQKMAPSCTSGNTI